MSKAEDAIETMAEEVNEIPDILMALEVLGGAALLKGDRRLYEHIMRAKVQYELGINLHLTDSFRSD
jgi:hypothetical protein